MRIDLPHSYKITNTKTGQIYIGVVLKSGKDYDDRFLDHISGKGSIKIKEQIESGIYTKDDYVIELISVYPDYNSAFKHEVELIAQYDSFDNGLNGNRGGGFGPWIIKDRFSNTQYCWKMKSNSGFYVDVINNSTTTIGQSDEDKSLRLSRGHVYPHIQSINQHLDWCSYWCDRLFEVYFSVFSKNAENGIKWVDTLEILNTNAFSENTKRRLVEEILKSEDRRDIMTVALRYIRSGENYFPSNYPKFDTDLIQVIQENTTTGFDKMFNCRLYRPESKNPTLSDGWKLGRERFRKRIANKDFTESELELHKNMSDMVKSNWKNMTEDQVKAKTSSGLSAMNKKDITCPHCGKTGLSKGNAKRWHYDNCKQKDTGI